MLTLISGLHSRRRTYHQLSTHRFAIYYQAIAFAVAVLLSKSLYTYIVKLWAIFISAIHNSICVSSLLWSKNTVLSKNLRFSHLINLWVRTLQCTEAPIKLPKHLRPFHKNSSPNDLFVMTLPTIVVVKGGDRPISISLFILVYIGPVKTATTASLNRQTYDQEGTINSLNGQFLASWFPVGGNTKEWYTT